MAKITDFQAPGGIKGNLLNPRDWLSIIIGFMVLIFGFAMAQNASRAVSSRIPALDSQIEKPWTDPVQVKASGEIVI